MAISGSASAASRSNFDRLEVQARQAADDFKMAEFFGADVHQKIFAVGIFAIQSLNRVLHRGSQFAVRAAELLEQHVAKAGIGLVDANGVHEFFDVVIHGGPSRVLGEHYGGNPPPSLMFLNGPAAICRGTIAPRPVGVLQVHPQRSRRLRTRSIVLGVQQTKSWLDRVSSHVAEKGYGLQMSNRCRCRLIAHKVTRRKLRLGQAGGESALSTALK